MYARDDWGGRGTVRCLVGRCPKPARIKQRPTTNRSRSNTESRCDFTQSRCRAVGFQRRRRTPVPERSPSKNSRSTSLGVCSGTHSKSVRAREQSIVGTPITVSNRPGVAGMACACHAVLMPERISRSGMSISRAPSNSAISSIEIGGSAARLNAPCCSPSAAVTYALATSDAWRTWIVSPRNRGSTGIHGLPTREPGRNGPANSRRCEDADRFWKMNPGRMRTTRVLFRSSNASRHRSR